MGFHFTYLVSSDFPEHNRPVIGQSAFLPGSKVNSKGSTHHCSLIRHHHGDEKEEEEEEDEKEEGMRE